MHSIAYLAAMMVVGAGSLAGQAPSAIAPDLAGSANSPIATDEAAARGFGHSGAVRVALAPAAALLSSEVLTRAGGWAFGHRWLPDDGGLGTAPAGVPVGAPVEASLELPPWDGLPEVYTPSDPGVWRLESGTGEAVTVITQVPASRKRGGRLNGYHIGTYPTEGSGRSDVYAPPSAFIEVTPENRHLAVSQHLTLAQFVTKDQFDVWPKYVALEPRLLDKLELVLQELNAMGIRAERIHVMSGFRTPQYNGPGGDGRAELSRHMWGDAADVWIDNDGDGQMDDLNGDGLIDTGDVAVMMRAVDRVERRYPELVGGAGSYPATSAHGPFIHIDARGYHSRW